MARANLEDTLSNDNVVLFIVVFRVFVQLGKHELSGKGHPLIKKIKLSLDVYRLLHVLILSLL